jgi:hypothetical protein
MFHVEQSPRCQIAPFGRVGSPRIGEMPRAGALASPGRLWEGITQDGQQTRIPGDDTLKRSHRVYSGCLCSAEWSSKDRESLLVADEQGSWRTPE